jgi:hypothetical protein
LPDLGGHLKSGQVWLQDFRSPLAKDVGIRRRSRLRPKGPAHRHTVRIAFMAYVASKAGAAPHRASR